MKRILLLYKAYPFTIASYFRHVLEKRPDVELVTAGEYYGDSIPWNGGMRLPAKYVKTVDLPLPPGMSVVPWSTIENRLGKDFDLILNVDATFHLTNKPPVPYAVIATDPHVLKEWYKQVRPLADYFFNMQKYAEYQLRDDDIWLPYACSPDHHYAMSDVKKINDACLVGLHYEQRNKLVQALRYENMNVHYSIGQVWDEYRIISNQSHIALNWSSLQDINARIFEGMAMRNIVLTNRLPHMEDLGLEEGKHYLGFDTIQEGVEKAIWARTNPDFAFSIALTGHNFVHENHTYEIRCETILRTCGLID